MRRRRWWIGSLLVVVSACRPSPTQPPEPQPVVVAEPAPAEAEPAPPDPRRPEVLARLERIGIIGASQAAGFGTGVGLADTLDVALRAPHRIHDSSVALMHLGAVETGSLQVTSMKLRRVSTVFAIDFLFWFAYGVKSSEQRMAELREGMAMLESMDVPVFVGDLPDVHGASRRMISPLQIPSPSDLAALNAEVHAWADRDPDIHLVPLAAWMDALKQERPLMLEGRPLEIATGDALQWDLQHPTALGQAALTLLLLQELRQIWGGLGEDDVHHQPAAVVDLAVPSREPAPEGALPRPPGS